MKGVNAGMLVSKLRAAGMDLWVEDGQIRGRMHSGRKPPYALAVMVADLCDLGMVAVDFLQQEALSEQPTGRPAQPDSVGGDKNATSSSQQRPTADGIALPEPDADGIVRLVRVSPEVAFAAGDLISNGKAKLSGNVVYRQVSSVFDLTYTTCS